MKQRVTALDLQILTAELQKEVVEYRLQNIYNIATSSKQYLLKFAVPDSKKNLVLDSGFKVHLTDFTRPTPQAPSNFVTKLRKHLKSRRLSSVRQVGIDRVVVLTFSDGMYHLVLEFFSAGNIVLLDSERRIMALQRLVEEKGNNDRYAVGETYNLFDESLFDEKDEAVSEARHYSGEEVQQWIQDKKAASQAEPTSKKHKVMSIQKILYQRVPHLSADLIAKNLNEMGINPSSSSLEYESNTDVIVEALNKTETDIRQILQAKPVQGYILTKKNPLYDSSKDDEDLKMLFDQFHPFQPLLKEGEELIEVSGYNKTLDKFFSTIESSKYALRIQNQENQAKKKIEQARNEKQQQVQRLIDVQEVNKLKGETIIFNADLVEEAKSAVQSLIDQSMDWKTIEKLIKVEQQKGNRVAKVINLPLNLKQNKISLNLLTEEAYEDEEEEDDDDNEEDSDESSGSETESEFDSDEDNEPQSSKKSKKPQNKVKNSINVSIDLSLSSYANASEYFTVKKTTVEKQKKVEQSATKALKNIEHKVAKDLKKNLKEEVDILKKLRTPYFFEKFNWFISNENYLILSGKDDAQTDMIYHRYITSDDIYVFADIDGASHVFIKNPNKGEVSPSTLTQAGILALATSKAWENKMVTSPWWCYASEITKNDIDGSILKAGNFRYLKEKRFLPPAQLVMGFAFLWKVKTEKNEKKLEDQLKELDELDINDVEDGDANNDESRDVEEAKEEEIDEGEQTDKNIEAEAAEDVQDNQQDEEAEDDQDSTEGTPEVEDQSDIMSTTTSNSKQKQKQVRGKKGKLRKIQEKYADQDEEERRLRIEALGTLKKQVKKEEELKKQQIQKINHLKKVEKRKRQEELTASKYANKKEEINYEDILDELTPTITKEDEILEAIPVFAPWNSLNKYRYRVKIQPGNTKKGKALQEILHYFSIRPTDPTENDRIYDWPREHETIKLLKDVELLPSVYVGKLKVLLPGKESAPKGSLSKNGNRKGKRK